MENLNKYGLEYYINTLKLEGINNNIARVLSVSKTQYTIITENGLLKAELTGNLLNSLNTEDYPKVGDWLEYIDFDSTGIITKILPRYSELYRKKAGRDFSKQVIATNIDCVFIVQGLDSNFNIMRLERYIAQSIACGIKPIIILNKCDLIEDKQFYLKEISKLQRDIEIYFCSTLTNEGIEEIKNKLLKSAETYIFVGSSGVGKSSLLNTLFNNYKQATQEISNANAKGKHTTTSRELFLLSNGSLIIDTPGMREFGIAFEDNKDLDDIFPIISQYAKKCKYKDCTHTNEANCAVLDALESGDISQTKYDAYLKLMREQEHYSESAHDKKRKGKQLAKMVKGYISTKKKNQL
ncbi:ribosome small subunit-dependent GTPase A [Marinilabiliaceae bacterium JC040]|nr:ribosome small subunit-dependent GTPase A [Marinilabiliaceae bacterium JC040]